MSKASDLCGRKVQGRTATDFNDIQLGHLFFADPELGEGIDDAAGSLESSLATGLQPMRPTRAS